MRFPIHEKITRQLSRKGRKKKELAQFLGIAPQTMTDICKGRSAVTLSHLKRLVAFFGLRATYWIDEDREEPTLLENTHLISEDELQLVEAVMVSSGSTRRENAIRLSNALTNRQPLWREMTPGAIEPLLDLLRQAARHAGDDAVSIDPSDDDAAAAATVES